MPTEKVQKKEKIPIKRSKNRKRKKQDEVRKERRSVATQQTLFSGYKWIAIDMSAIVDTMYPN